MQATVGTKYQIVIPKEVRKKIRGLDPGNKVTIRKVDDSTVIIKTEEKNWLERTRGMMKQAWKDIDTTRYLEGLKDEWDKKS